MKRHQREEYIKILKIATLLLNVFVVSLAIAIAITI
jgi:hypothetical protein